MESPDYLRYWGKWSRKNPKEYHLLAYHALDAAACCAALMRLARYKLDTLAEELGWSLRAVEGVFTTMMALHDVGKFAPGFQNLQKAEDTFLLMWGEQYFYDARTARHDTLGWLLWNVALKENFPKVLGKSATTQFWQVWVRAVMGHHGKPPTETLDAEFWEKYFAPEQIAAAREFHGEIARMFWPEDLPSICKEQCRKMAAHSWKLTGMAVLADWLASNQNYFPYCNEPMSLEQYYKAACGRAEEAIRVSGLDEQTVAAWQGSAHLLPQFRSLTPLQQYACDEPLGVGSQFFLLEDVTGAGKTEAALLLAHRLMSSGNASGIYFALPTMATANQLYQRVGNVYRRFYAAEAHPSLVLAHGARKMVRAFRQSILPAAEMQECDHPQDASGSAQCAAWMADSNKKAMLADVGVGTIDQALQAILPVRHQSLRLLGLASKVLIVDEVHAYDAYMTKLLEALLRAQARQGGSVILLSATVPSALRVRLLQAFQQGCDAVQQKPEAEMRYPLATHWLGNEQLQVTNCATRPQLERVVEVRFLQSEQQCIELLQTTAQEQHCGCWIRNTVEDARRAQEQLESGNSTVQLFHSRYAMGDRLQIEEEVLRRFGSCSGFAERAGRLLAASQVVEQSLDLDFDVLISDLAPVDLLIQRAGRLHRHVRNAHGDHMAAAQDERRPAVLYVLAPEWTEDPQARWYADLFPGGSYVYPDAGQLWRTQKALRKAGAIRTPGGEGEVGSVRWLMESVYGDLAAEIPAALQKSANDDAGKQSADRSLAQWREIDTRRGYCMDGSTPWLDAGEITTRLGEESQTVYLAKVMDGKLYPIFASEELAWELSRVQVSKRMLSHVAPEWLEAHREALAELRGNPLLEESCVLPMVQESGQWCGCAVAKDKAVKVVYCRQTGLQVRAAEGR